ITAANRAKTPMPPPFPETWPDKQTDDYAAPSAVASLAQLAAEIARDSTGAVPSVESLPDNAYERLPPCLPDA
ncbi:MAG: hypothetical protein WCE38_07115, partial [Burkholderiales bacterium]